MFNSNEVFPSEMNGADWSNAAPHVMTKMLFFLNLVTNIFSIIFRTLAMKLIDYNANSVHFQMEFSEIFEYVARLSMPTITSFPL